MVRHCLFVVWGGRDGGHDGGREGGRGGGRRGSSLDDRCAIVRGSSLFIRDSSLFMVRHCRSRLL